MKTISLKKVLLRLEVLLPLVYTLLYIPLSQISFGGFFTLPGDLYITLIGTIPTGVIIFILSLLIGYPSYSEAELVDSLGSYLYVNHNLSYELYNFSLAFLGYIIIGYLLDKLWRWYNGNTKRISEKYNTSRFKRIKK